MGTDRQLEYQGPCACGIGVFCIIECSPDHAWPSSSNIWYVSEINCSHCAEPYQIEHRGKQFLLMEKSKLQRREALRDEASSRGKALMETEAVRTALRVLEKRLVSQNSTAAIFRFLQPLTFVPQTEATFRKHWRGPSEWIERQVRPWNLERVLAFVGPVPPEVMGELAAIRDLETAADSPVDPVGAPIHEIR